MNVRDFHLLKYVAGFALLSTSWMVNANLITNGTFDSGLSGWNITANGTDVTWEDGEARVGQPGPQGSATLSQIFDIAAGTTHLSISFDYLWDVTPPETPDYFEAIFQYKNTSGGSGATTSKTLVMENSNSDGVTFGSTRNYSGVVALTNLLDGSSNGSISFTLEENNGKKKGSRVHVDNVIVAVPEPTILALFAAGLFGLVFARRRKIG